MTDDSTTKRSMLVWIEMVTAEFTTSHLANRMNEVGAVKILETVLVGIVGVGTTVKVVSRRILPTLLITSILWLKSVHVLGRTPRDLRDNPPR